MVHGRLGLLLGKTGVKHGGAVTFQAGLQGGQGLDANHHRPADFRHLHGGGFTDAGADQRRMGLLIGTGTEQRKLNIPMLSFVAQLLARPRLDQ